MGKVMIDLSEVVHNFRSDDELVSVIKMADFQIEENSFNLIYGSSGSGKSTLLNILSGMQEPTQGKVLVEGRNIYELSSDELAFFRANRLGIVYQTTNWVKSLNVVENVALPLYFLGYKRPTSERIAVSVLERVGMGGYANKSPLVLSGGEQQRIAMARALATNPLFVIADEPTGNLDATNSDKIIDLLQNCKTEFRCTVIMVTHNMEYVSLADKLISIVDGVAEALPGSDMTSTANKLMKNMQLRIDMLARKKKHV